MEDAIVREVIHGEGSDGTRIEIVIEIGAPYPHPQSENEWICPVNAPELRYPSTRSHGISALQALCLGLASVRNGLIHFRQKGGKLGFEPGLDDYLIGATFGVDEPIAKS